MFTQFFFLLLSLSLISFAPGKRFYFWINQSHLAFVLGLLVYILTLGLIYWQTKVFKHFKKFSNWSLNLALIELLLFLCIYQFGLGSQRLLLQYLFPSSVSLVSLSLYLFGLGWAYYSTTHDVYYSREQVLFTLPLCFPFLFFDLSFDVCSRLPNWMSLHAYLPAFLIGYSDAIINTSLLAATSILMPFLIIKCWRCQPLQDKLLLDRLENICRQLQFKHAGIKIWTVMKHAFTAGIIGVVPRFRYVMFTEKLLQRFHSEEIEAILVHEIGHSRHRHLLFYPFILMGMLLSSYLSFLFILEPLAQYMGVFQFFKENAFLPYLISFMGYALFLGFYFRIIFGFFSRLFERQADLYIFESSLAPASMIQALDRIAVLSGYIHRQPSWHHFSIQERIDFLSAAIQNPHLIARHHSRVKRWLWIYFILLAIGVLILIHTG